VLLGGKQHYNSAIMMIGLLGGGQEKVNFANCFCNWQRLRISQAIFLLSAVEKEGLDTLSLFAVSFPQTCLHPSSDVFPTGRYKYFLSFDAFSRYLFSLL